RSTTPLAARPWCTSAVPRGHRTSRSPHFAGWELSRVGVSWTPRHIATARSRGSASEARVTHSSSGSAQQTRRSAILSHSPAATAADHSRREQVAEDHRRRAVHGHAGELILERDVDEPALRRDRRVVHEQADVDVLRRVIRDLADAWVGQVGGDRAHVDAVALAYLAGG